MRGIDRNLIGAHVRVHFRRPSEMLKVVKGTVNAIDGLLLLIDVTPEDWRKRGMKDIAVIHLEYTHGEIQKI